MTVTRRGLLQMVSAFVAASAATRRTVISKLDLGDVTDAPVVDAEPVTVGTRPTKLERFLRSRGIKPSHLARESGYSRQFLLGLRMGRVIPEKRCVFALSAVCSMLARERVRPRDLFDVWLPNSIRKEEE